MQEERRSRTREAPKAPGRGETMTPTGLGHTRVMSPDTACARVASSSTECPGRPATAVCQGGVLSGLVVGDGESPLQGEGPDGSTQPAQETRAGQAGSDQHEPTSRRVIANRAKESKHRRFRNLFQEVNAELLIHGWHVLNKAAASGVDGLTAETYATNLEGNIADLAERVKAGRYPMSPILAPSSMWASTRPERGLRPPSSSPPGPPGYASADRGAPSRAECGPGPCRTSGWYPRRRPDNP